MHEGKFFYLLNGVMLGRDKTGKLSLVRSDFLDESRGEKGVIGDVMWLD